MRVPGLDLAVWLRRLGVRDSSQLEAAESVQPVVSVGDHSWLAPPLDVAYGLSGWRVLGTAGNFSFYKLSSRAPGGLYVRCLQVGSNQAVPGSTHDLRFSFGIGEVTQAVGGVSSLNPRRPIRSTAGSGQTAATIMGFVTGDIPMLWGGTGLQTPQISAPFIQFDYPGLWVPPGSSFVLETISTQTGMAGWLLFVELDQQPTPQGIS